MSKQSTWLKKSQSETLSHNYYQIGLICALPDEVTAVTAILDEEHELLDQNEQDSNVYTLGRVGAHNVVVGCLPFGASGGATAVAKDMLLSFPNIKVALMIGIGGGAPGSPSEDPESDIRLGDVFVSKPGFPDGGLVQYDYNKTISESRFVPKEHLSRSPNVLVTALTKLMTRHELTGSAVPRHLALMRQKYPKMKQKWQHPGLQNDKLYAKTFKHNNFNQPCEVICRSELDEHLAMKDAVTREKLQFPCLIIRGICDYSDSHENKTWKAYAGAASAAVAKELLEGIRSAQVEKTDTVNEAHNDRESFLNWLAPSTYHQKQADAYKLWEKGTGTWFLEHPQLKEWLDAHRPENRILLCSGGPGVGKTTMVSVVVEHLRTSEKEQGSIVCFFFLNRNAQTVPRMIRAILRQLLEGLPSIPDEFINLQDETQCLSEKGIQQALMKAAKSYKRAFIIVDGLSESPLFEIHDFFNAIMEMQSAGARVMVTSDDTKDLRLEPQSKNQNRFSELDIRDGNIEIYIDRNFDLSGFYSLPAEQAEIEKFKRIIIFSARGSFLLARLYLNWLKTKDTREKLEEELDSIANTHTPSHSSTLNEAYRKTFDIVKRSPRRLAFCVLSWVFYAMRPLSTTELSEALNTQHQRNNKELKVKHAPPDMPGLVSLSEGLIAISPISATVDFVHHTAYIWYSYNRTGFPRVRNASRTIAMTCLKYLSFEAFATGFVHDQEALKNRIDKHPFLNYAARFWAIHVHFNQNSSKVRSAAKRFLQNTSLASCAEQIVLGVPFRREDPPITGLHLVAKYGLVTQFEDLTDEDCHMDFNGRDAFGVTPLLQAIKGGHVNLVRMLVESDEVETNICDLDGWTPLMWAAKDGSTRITRSLLSVDQTRLNCQNRQGDSALMVATKFNHPIIVGILKQHESPDPNLTNENGMTALMFAVRNSSVGIVQKLLGIANVDPDICNHHGATALGFAVLSKNVEIVLSIPISIRSRRRHFWLSNHPSDAVRRNDAVMVSLLLNEGNANTSIQSPQSKTALDMAKEKGYDEIVQLLSAKRPRRS
ncbi:hypothetical protein P170DRAFT_488625 [Aspergillus steynii IBT 23096]|uniref:Uncharacterized protein n=1 Tax=Aspergillus steynii IBT 23096 TaxID=1392250 RepID=A0A2I2GGX9_9EURO|nr:uncharacterized protein P170DRAFT_488625 [Aspergillus steynii IBT 23096]PLB52138.1 hypothetical protein P170DRAFT_488625 [Aspergillus steynii IBT 23096]